MLVFVADTFESDRRVRRESKTIAKYFDSVNVLCWDRLGKRRHNEKIDECEVTNLKLFGYSTLAKSFSEHVNFVLNAFFFQIIMIFWALRRINAAQYTVIHSHDFNTLLGAITIKQITRGRVSVVYDSHEYTPGAYAEWYGPTISSFARILEIQFLSRIDGAIGANEAIASYLSRFVSGPTITINACPELKEPPSISRAESKSVLKLSDHFVILFTGGIRQDYDIPLLFQAAKELKARNLDSFRFVFVGPIDTMTGLMNDVRKESLSNYFEFKGWVPDEQLLLHFLASDLCFAVASDRGENTKILTPVRVFDSFSCGVPVLVRKGTLIASIVIKGGCGVAVDDKTKLSDELIRLRMEPGSLQIMQEAGLKLFREKYNWGVMENRLMDLYAGIFSNS